MAQRGGNRNDPDREFTTEETLLEEYAAIACDDWVDGAPPRRSREWLHARAQQLNDIPKTALCLSGGGVRSAAFCLGGLQALAEKGLLGEFNYLSTVSGGGYIGAWLTTIMHGGGLGDGALKAAVKALTDRSDPALRSLRNYTNFLLPEGGFGSSDSWSAVMLWLRNVLLNWLVFGPILFAVALLPLCYREVLWEVSPGVGRAAFGIGLACLLFGSIAVCRDVPTHAYERIVDRRRGRYGASARRIQLGIVAPMLGWAFLAPVWYSAVSAQQNDVAAFLSGRYAPAAFGVFIALVGGYAIAALTLGRSHYAAFSHNAAYWIIGAIVSSVLVQCGATLGQQLPATALAVLAPLWVIGAQLTHSTIYIGLRWSAAYAELDREWLARLNGEKLVPILVWSILAGITLVVPALVFEQWPSTYAAVIGVASGPVSALLGKSAQSIGRGSNGGSAGAGWSNTLREAAILVATLLFAATLFMLLGQAGGVILERLEVAFASWPRLDHPWLLVLLAIALLVALSWYCGRRININRFSLHGVYRNRLARAFIGTARPPAQRKPDAYTRFDPEDNLRMQDLYQGRQQRGLLFPVVNVTLNLLEGAPSGWAERKAAPFTITPLRSGAACLDRLHPNEQASGRYVRTEEYAGQEHEMGRDDAKNGITLGTAMTISGAAVSPNMGYHSSPATSFLMTLFDVRLGAWLPNPGVGHRWTPAKPSNALWPLFNEMLGRANDQRADISLSDGGHFDNLGVYEMLRRRCRVIVSIDAGCDPEYHYNDLGNSLRLAAIDFNIRVRFVAPIIKGGKALNAAGAYARIEYPDAPDGHLLYLKPWLPQALPADILAYFGAHGDFPHQSTADQFFSESQFESYRALGELVVGEAFRQSTSLADIVTAAEQNAGALPPEDPRQPAPMEAAAEQTRPADGAAT